MFNDRKADERRYFESIGEAGLIHAANKPWSDEGCGAYLQELGPVFSLLPPPPARLLDIGCGAGWTSALFAARGYDVTGIDLSPTAIEFAARRHLHDGLRYAVHDFDEPLNDDDGAYDIAIFFDALHHADDERRPLRLAFRALRPGGVCVLLEPGVGHATAEVARVAAEDHGVTERDMPPKLVLSAARAVGFGRAELYPHPQRFSVPTYRRRGQDPSLRRRLLELPGVPVLRAVYAATVERRRWGLILLVKP